MKSLLVTCPETAHLEQIEFDDHPLGMLVTSCTRFSPACAVRCNRVCAARLDRKRRSSPEFIDEEDTQFGEDTLVMLRLP